MAHRRMRGPGGFHGRLALALLAAALLACGGLGPAATPAPSPTAATLPPAASPTPAPTEPAALPPGAGNLAYQQPVTASALQLAYPPARAVDGISSLDADNRWSAGSHPPQWIEIDLGGPAFISAVRLYVSQYPAGATRHRVYGRAPGGEAQLLHEFSGPTADGDMLEARPPAPWAGFQFIRVETVESPSWVSWREIEVLGELDTTVAPTPAPTARAERPPDLIFHNAHVLTMDPAHPTAQAVAVLGDVLLAVGSNAEVLPLAGAATRLVDLGGRTLTPGFIDSHQHRLGDRWLTGESSAEAVIQDAIAKGWTGLHELFVTDGRLDELRSLDEVGQLRLRVAAYLTLNFQHDEAGTWYQAYTPRQALSPRLKIAGLKITLDQEWGETIFFAPDRLNAVVAEASGLGWQVATHVFAHRSMTMILDAYAAALAGAPNDVNRHRLEHVAIVDDEQLARIAALGLIASVQLNGTPGWPDDASFRRYVPPEQFGYVARFRDMLNAGVFLIGNTDAPWGTVDWRNHIHPTAPGTPMEALYEAVTRITYTGRAPEPWQTAQTLTVEQALPMLTINGAYAGFDEHRTGSLVPGKLADLVILSDDPLSVPTDALRDITVLLTMIGGRVEYCAPSAAVCP